MSISLYQLIPYDREDVNGLFVEFTVGNPVPPSCLSVRLTAIYLISPDPIPSIRRTPVENVIDA